jgi:hypothetical protein
MDLPDRQAEKDTRGHSCAHGMMIKCCSLIMPLGSFRDRSDGLGTAKSPSVIIRRRIRLRKPRRCVVALTC